ncbi:MAG TPA: class I SAM-dependent methyltransferase [Aggregatilineales bacterium]|nr:class I SAM-dependent methyltransferase [Aggregatilineales bacterium]
MSDSPYAPHVGANVERFMGFAQHYDQYRPAPPKIILDILTQLARVERPHCVVDIGSGTGLATRLWADRAGEVIGIEPSADMRREAESRPLSNVRYQHGLSTQTGLGDSVADIVTVSQALHWMEPVGTFAEVARILRPGGVFAAFDNDWKPTIDAEAEIAYRNFMRNAARIESEQNYSPHVIHWEKEQHLERMRASERFSFTKEVAVHNVEQGNAERLVGLALSQGQVQTLIKNGVSAQEMGLDALQADAERILGETLRPWYFTYRVRIGIR